MGLGWQIPSSFLETLFIPVTNEARAGTYFAYGYARSKKDNFICSGCRGYYNMVMRFYNEIFVSKDVRSPPNPCGL